MSQETEEQYRSIFENAVEGIYQTTVDGRYLRVNPALARIYGYRSPDDLIDNLTDIAGQLYVDPGKREAFARLMAERDVVQSFEARVFRNDGSIIWISENARCVRDPQGRIRYYEGTVQDITERKQHEEKIRLLATVFDSVADGILIVDPDLSVQAVNPAYEVMTDFQREALLHRPLVIFAPGSHERAFIEDIWRTARTEGRWQGEVTSFRHSGDAFAASLSVTAVRAPGGVLEHYVLTLADISQRKYQEHQIRYQASFDRLTDLPNRWLVCERLEEAIVRAQRMRTKVAVAFLDLNRFKQVNDTLGHHAGDDLLKLVAKRLRNCTRVSDTVGRLGGDEFLIVAPDAVDRAAGARLVEKVLYSMGEPFAVHNQELFCGASIGVAFFPDDGETADQLLRNADLAMYHAKRNPECKFVFYEAGMRERTGFTLGLESDLRRAAATGEEFELHFQPKVDMPRRGFHRVIGAEALIRWRHPVRGLVSPAEFIPLAEETGLIWEIGAWTLREACGRLAGWLAAGLDIASVSVNLSPRQFQDARLVNFVRDVVDRSGVPPERLELELTEGAMIGDIEKAVTILHGLKGIGIRLSIDDFGTGYSSLAYLKRFPINTLKIDRSFVRDIVQSSTDPAIVNTIVNLADSLGFDTIAEGVETEEQADMLRRQRCTRIQGFLISRPLDVDAFERFLVENAG
ncbi:PAS domain S-box-containing protein/diguanylate cyclase (GGDEF)-like protein [Azospirillum brasilense]|uniref:PAS domain S-box-containing protein/diguanylate cyclase (GGDEF)-like protein n=1 Tax=Azospirillum brasilense TaxID=192 RepID=A0A560BSP9_AZOBR|nr:EAL domain-containing protein [Azospirillum brasilense]MBK3736909.1 EAL domain-containing protein [Azospirillum brasilense]TWA75651.1 PAS domain S-box-containing protein/diguanylate cyclase (GGDEF)-like protein [Azospirillum brasilense]